MKILVKKPTREAPALSSALVLIGLACLVMAYAVYLRPEFRVNQEFVATSCIVLDKQLVTLQDRNGTVYRPEIHIRYTVDGRTYEARTYNITGESTSGRAHKEEILNRFEIGQRYTCWYDPGRPQTAVLVRGYSLFGFLLAGFGALITLIGGVGML
jgi:hypothetical protein